MDIFVQKQEVSPETTLKWTNLHKTSFVHEAEEVIVKTQKHTLHIPAYYHVLAAPKRFYLKKNTGEFSGKKSQAWTINRKKDRLDGATELGRTREEIGNWNQMTALRLQI